MKRCLEKEENVLAIFEYISLTSYSRFVTVTPGDVVITGTPPGVGCFRKPPVYLKVSFCTYTRHLSKTTKRASDIYRILHLFPTG